jgi:hypothetical protein
MSAMKSANEARTSTLLVCDQGGWVQAVSSRGATAPLLDRGAAQKHFAEVFGRDSTITEWLTERIGEARKQEEYFAESDLQMGGELAHVMLESLKGDRGVYGFAIQVMPGRGTGPVIEEGDSIVLRKQWHEIKNHVGALKLYATFLTKKMPEGDERQTVEKMLNGINTLIEYLAKIRRGEPQ